MKNDLANLALTDEEEEAFEKDEAVVDQNLHLCLVGRYLTDSIFFHEVDIQRVFAGTPWFFNNHLLLLHMIQPGEIPSLVPLIFTEFWIQVHDLPPGL
ncbi:hypothetical protein Gohar_007843, partial [Gossypium harknessii]|nr:hypothetical protein [Gossypium harknessii]